MTDTDCRAADAPAGLCTCYRAGIAEASDKTRTAREELARMSEENDDLRAALGMRDTQLRSARKDIAQTWPLIVDHIAAAIEAQRGPRPSAAEHTHSAMCRRPACARHDALTYVAALIRDMPLPAGLGAEVVEATPDPNDAYETGAPS